MKKGERELIAVYAPDGRFIGAADIGKDEEWNLEELASAFHQIRKEDNIPDGDWNTGDCFAAFYRYSDIRRKEFIDHLSLLEYRAGRNGRTTREIHLSEVFSK